MRGFRRDGSAAPRAATERGSSGGTRWRRRSRRLLADRDSQPVDAVWRVGLELELDRHRAGLVAGREDEGEPALVAGPVAAERELAEIAAHAVEELRQAVVSAASAGAGAEAVADERGAHGRVFGRER